MRKVIIGSTVCEDVPSSIGGYEIGCEIGRGAYSTIFRAVKNETTFAVKVVSRKFLIEHGDVTKFEREVTVFSRLDHPNIIKFYEMLSDESLIYIVMEYCSCGTLETLITRGRALGEAEAKPVVRQICLALSHIHSLGIAHRDLKLENILVGDRGVVKLADFGFCRELTQGELMRTQCGSPLFAAPEIVCNKEYDGRKADMWSLGVCIYTLVLGCLPWRDTKNLSNLFYDIQTCRYHVPSHLSALFKNLIHVLMHPLPEMRLNSQQVLNHPWLMLDVEKFTNLDTTVPNPLNDSVRSNSMFSTLTGSRVYRPMRARPRRIQGTNSDYMYMK